MPGKPHPLFQRLSGDRILGAAVLISLAMHALALLPNYFSPVAAGSQPLRATLHRPDAAPAAPAMAPPALDEAIAAPKREALPEPLERTYSKSSPSAHHAEVASESTSANESSGAPSQADSTSTPSAESTALPPLPRPGIDLAGLRQYHAALSRVAARFRTYPAQAREAGWEGLVSLRLSVSEAGTPVGLELIGSSGYPILDRAALEMMQLAAAHTLVPDSLRGRAFTIDLAARYDLKDGF